MKPSVTRKSLSLWACLGAVIAVQPCALAQQIPTPGQVREQLRPPPRLPSREAPAIAPAPAPAAATGVAPGGRAVLVSAFDIAGNRSIEAGVLQQVIAGYVGRPLTLAEIYEAADALTRYYRKQGYTLASAYVPEQKIGGGVVRIEILEGTLGTVKLEGAGRLRPEFVTWQLDRLQPGMVVRDEPLENELLLLNDNPGVNAKALVRPGADFGTSDLVITTQERRVDGNVRLNNYGRESIGEWKVEGTAGLNGLLGIGDRLEVNAVHAEADLTNYGWIGYSLPISRWGTRASIYYSGYEYSVNEKKLGGGALTSLLDIEGDGNNFGARVDHPVWRARNRNLYVGFGVDRTNTDQHNTNLPGERPIRQNLTLAILDALFTYVGSDQSFSTLGAAFSTNFNAADRERDPQTGLLLLENNAQTAKLQLDLSHYRTLYRRLASFTRFTGVASVDPLVDLERFRLGGPDSVRGYASSELVGDSGFFLSTELQHPIPFITGMPTIVKVFADTGRVYRKNHNLIGVEHSESLSAAGFGLQTSAYQRVFFDVSVAQPLGAHDTSDTNRGARFWASVSANF